MTKAREFIEFWIENSVHAGDGAHGASQDVTELTRRCLEMAEDQGISEQDINAEIGNLAEFLGRKLEAANKVEAEWQQREKGPAQADSAGAPAALSQCRAPGTGPTSEDGL